MITSVITRSPWAVATSATACRPCCWSAPHNLGEPAPVSKPCGYARSSSATRMTGAVVDRVSATVIPYSAQPSKKTRKMVRRGRLSSSIRPPCSPMIFATSARPRPVPLCLPDTKRIENMRPDRFRDAVAVIFDADHQRQVARGRCHWQHQPKPALISGSTVRCRHGTRDRLRGVLDQVGEHPHQLLTVAIDRRAATDRNARRM